MANFDEAYDMVLANEGGYSNDTTDLGGETYKGISSRYYSSLLPYLPIIPYALTSSLVSTLIVLDWIFISRISAELSFLACIA